MYNMQYRREVCVWLNVNAKVIVMPETQREGIKVDLIIDYLKCKLWHNDDVIVLVI